MKNFSRRRSSTWRRTLKKTKGRTTTGWELVDKYYWGEDNHTNYLKTLRSITPKDVQAMLQQILKDSRYLELIASGVEKK